MLRVPSTFLLLAVTLAASCPLYAQAQTWKYSEPVEFRVLGERGLYAVLADGRELEMDFDHTDSLTFADVSRWTGGKPLTLAYSTTVGAALVNPDTGKFVRIVAGLKDHPIDKLQAACDKGADTTRAMVDCSSNAGTLWDAELNRVYQELLKTLKPSQANQVKAAQRAWIEYRDRTVRAIAAVKNEGSVSAIINSIETTTLTREQALRLQRMYAVE